MSRGGAAEGMNEDQRAAADAGLKALIPFHGQPYLSYGLSALADGGVRDACLVVRGGADPIRAHYTACPPDRLRLEFVEQPQPRGSADALLCAEAAVRGEPFLLVNADNVYPPEAIARIARLPGPGLAAFTAGTLIAGGIPAERLAGYAIVVADGDGALREIREKPGAEAFERAGDAALVSMTCWRFDESIFDACRAIRPSARGELELPDAVAWALARGHRFEVVHAGGPVLDLTSREDIPRVAAALARETARP